MNYQTTVASDQEDGAPRRGERKAEGGYEADGEKRLEGPARMRSCRIKREGPRVPKGDLIRAVEDHLRAAGAQLLAAGVHLQAAEKHL